MPSSLWKRVTDIRYGEAIERFLSARDRLTTGRSVVGVTAGSVATEAQRGAQAMPEAPASPPLAPPSLPMQALIKMAGGIAQCVEWEKEYTSKLLDSAAKLTGITYRIPGAPALRAWDFDIGLPHAHNHPPNITPPSPVPIPLPSVGFVFYAPIVSCAATTQINGQRAARCGDLGAAFWCGGYVPLFEIFFGSSSVWIEGARAARQTIDVARHCMFSAPKPSDPPLGPMLGTTITGSPNVFIGGVPMPSFFSLACAGAFKLLFKGAGMAFRQATARSFVQRLLDEKVITILGSDEYRRAVTADLNKIAKSSSGRSVLKRLARSKKRVTIKPYEPRPEFLEDGKVVRDSPFGARATFNARTAGADAVTGKPGPGSNTVIDHSPELWANNTDGKLPAPTGRDTVPEGRLRPPRAHEPIPEPPLHPNPGSTSDAVLFHELNHATNAAEGKMPLEEPAGQTGWQERWKEYEEYATTHADNGYRREQGLPERQHYRHMP